MKRKLNKNLRFYQTLDNFLRTVPVGGFIPSKCFIDSEAAMKHKQEQLISFPFRYIQSGHEKNVRILFEKIEEADAIVLSGMSNVEQMEDNLSYMKQFRPLDIEEQTAIRKAAESGNSGQTEVPEGGSDETEEGTSASGTSGSVVYMTADISPEGLAAVYEALGWTPAGSVAVKISTGEPPASNYLRSELIADLVQSVKGTIVECNTAYGGSRAETAMHYQVAKKEKWIQALTRQGYML